MPLKHFMSSALAVLKALILMSAQAWDLEAILRQDTRVRQATVSCREGSLLLAEISVQDSSATISLIELLGRKRFALPVVLAIKGSSEMLDVPAARRRAGIDTPYEIAQTRQERQIIDLWQTLLEWTPIGRRDNFFGLGGDSLTGTMLIEQLSDELGLNLELHDLLNAPVLHEFTSHLAVLQGTD
jgi:hypothetical protein